LIELARLFGISQLAEMIFPDPPATFSVRAKELIELTGFRGHLLMSVDVA
jgi:hypothetical protein